VNRYLAPNNSPIAPRMADVLETDGGAN